jgi:hypothetical protein
VENTYPDLENLLAPLAEPPDEPLLGDWLAEHPEPGQTFAQYLARLEGFCREQGLQEEARWYGAAARRVSGG